MCKRLWVLVTLIIAVFAAINLVTANNYTADVYFTIPDSVYTIDERIELKGYVYYTNYTEDGTLVSNYTALADTDVNLTIRDTSGLTINNYSLATDANGTFYSKSNYYSDGTEINASSTAGDYYIRAEYKDPNDNIWYSELPIVVVNQSLDNLKVSSQKARYYPSEDIKIRVEAARLVGDKIRHVSNVSVNGTLRNSSQDIIESFSCTTENNGKCKITLTAPSTEGSYILELNDFKAFSSFQIISFSFNAYMKDELGKSFKNVYAIGEQARVEVQVVNASDSDVYTFSGYIADPAGNVVKSITSTVLNSTNSFTNSFLFTVDAITFSYGTYAVLVNVSKSGDGSITSSTLFRVEDWTLSINKKESNSGFEYEYSVFPDKTMLFEAYPKYRINGSIIENISSSRFSINIKDNLNNIISSTNASWNESCGTEGCYEFFLTSPTDTGKYKLSVEISYDGSTQTESRIISVMDEVMSAQSTNKDGSIKELFGTNEYAYISLTAYNSTSSGFNLSDAEIFTITYMNGSEFNYAQVNDFNEVNSTNSIYEWAWDSALQRIKLDVPKVGGLYNIFIFGNNQTLGAFAKFIVNPYDICSVPKDTPGQVSSGYYYVWQFKTTDTIYFELKTIQADNPLGKATASNFSSGNGSTGTGSACVVDTSSKQVVNNATISILEVKNAESGSIQSINITESTCQSDDSQGGYTCIIKPLDKWEGGQNIVKFQIEGQDGTIDVFYSNFEARAFYLYGWSSTWQNNPSSNISLSVQLYEAGRGWWGSGGGLSGTITVKKVEYQGRDGEWIWPPVDSGYNVSALNSSSITSGTGYIEIPAEYNSEGEWKTGNYRVVLQGTTSSGEIDYGYAWFGVKLWDVYGQPVECTDSSCYYKSYFNSKENLTLYIKISKAGSYSYDYSGGEDIYDDVYIGIKKIEDCRTWPCKELNSSEYEASTINVNGSSQWYWNANLSSASDYLLEINKTSGTWGTGYYNVVLDVNGTDTGYAWFSTIAFYVAVKSTDINGSNYQYNIKPGESKYFNVTPTKSYKGWDAVYDDSDFVNTTIDEVILRTWDQQTWQTIEYNYPEDINITPTSINGSVLLNLTFNNGSWQTGYYWGELTLRNEENETSTGWLGFNVRPFRVSTSTSSYNIDSDQCVNLSLDIYEPDWSSSELIDGNYSIDSIYEDIWGYSGRSKTTYTNYTSDSFNASANIVICPNNNSWGVGSWGGYHYLNIVVQDNSDNSTEIGWLSFRASSFQVSWSSVTGGSNKLTGESINVSANLTKSFTGASASGNLTRVYQNRWDEVYAGVQDYVFSVGSCFSNVSGQCTVNGTQEVIIYSPSTGWRIGYNYLYVEWSEEEDSSSTVQDWSGIYIEGREAYNGYYENRETNDYWKYDFEETENLAIKIYTRNSNYNSVDVNITNVYYAAPDDSCNSEWCRSYTDSTWSLVGGGVQTSSGSAIIIINAPLLGWSKGKYYIKTRVSGSDGTTTITGGELRVKDMIAPNVSLSLPTIGQSINSTTFSFNATTTENADCTAYLISYDTFANWYCEGWNSTSNESNTTLREGWYESCNHTFYDFNGSTYYHEYVSDDYNSADYRADSSNYIYWYSSGTTGLITGGTTHSFMFNTTNKPTGEGLPVQDYGLVVWCYDEYWNSGVAYSAFNINVSNESSSSSSNLSVTINSPANTTYNDSSITFNFTLNEEGYCEYSLDLGINNITMQNNGNQDFNDTNDSIEDGSYTLLVYCNDSSGNNNYTESLVFTVSSSEQVNITLIYPTNGLTLTSSSFTLNYSVNIQANCSQYWNVSGWEINSNVVNSGDISIGASDVPNGDYIWNVYCFDVDNSSNDAWAEDSNWTFTINAPQEPINITLVYPTNESVITTSNFTFNYSVNIQANCSHYWNIDGNWTTEANTITSGDSSLDATDIVNGEYIWNVYCFDVDNSSNDAWAEDSNWTFTINAPQEPISVTMFYPTDGETINTSGFSINYSVNIQANCTLYSNISSSWGVEESIIDSLNNSFDLEDVSNGNYIWNIYCFDIYNSSNAEWGNTTANWTLTIDVPYLEESLLEWVRFGRTLDNNRYYNGSVDITNLSLTWDYDTGGAVASSPIIKDDVLYVGSSASNIFALNATNGTLIWNNSLPGAVYGSPVTAEDIIYVAGDNYRLYALNSSDGSEIWNKYIGADVGYSSPVVEDDKVYLATYDNDTLYAYNATNGIIIWEYQFSDTVAGALAIEDDVVYLGSRGWAVDNNFSAINATSGNLIWNATISDAIYSSPAVAYGMVYFGCIDNNVYALNITDGEQVWNFTTGGDVYASPAVYNGTIYIGSFDDSFYALDAFTGVQLRNYTTGGDIYSSAAVSDETIFFGIQEDAVGAGMITALNLLGENIWNYTGSNNDIDSSPSIANGRVYVGGDSNYVYAFETT